MIDAPYYELDVEDVFFLSNGVQVIVGRASEDVGTIAPCFAVFLIDDVEFRRIKILSERFSTPNPKRGTRSLETRELSDCDKSGFQNANCKLVCSWSRE